MSRIGHSSDSFMNTQTNSSYHYFVFNSWDGADMIVSTNGRKDKMKKDKKV